MLEPRIGRTLHVKAVAFLGMCVGDRLLQFAAEDR